MATTSVTLKEIDGGREATITATLGGNYVLTVGVTALLVDGAHFRRQLARLGVTVPSDLQT